MNGTDVRTPLALEGIVLWLRLRLFPNWPSAAVTLTVVYLAWYLLPRFVDWAFFNSVWAPDNSELCRRAAGHGACWAFIADKYRFILFGTYPAAAHWRPAWVIVILLTLYAVSAVRVLAPKRLASLWTVGLAVIGALMWGGVFGLTMSKTNAGAASR